MKAVLRWALPSTVLSSVVAELTSGARTPKAREFGWTIGTRDAVFSATRNSIAGLTVAAPFRARPSVRRASV